MSFDREMMRSSGLPCGDTNKILTVIWKRVLGKDAIQPEDDFFDLGGNPAAAHVLFAEIAQEFGRELCALLIYQAPTILQLAGVIERTEPPEVASVLSLKKGSGAPSIFLGHGLGSTVMDLFPLVQNMRSQSPIYGMQARGIDGRQPPHRRIEDMAEYHLGAIRKLQPHGPYFLIGYSLAGLICIEIARRLIGGGESVGLLAVLDSWPHIRRLQFRQQVRLTLQRTKEKTLSLLRNGTPRATRPSLQSNGQNGVGLQMTPSMEAAFERVKEAQFEALRTYKPSFYDGKIVFVQAGTVFHLPDSPEAIWKHLVREFELHSLPCDHASMLSTRAGALASILTDCINH
jgi:acetoacetyl-CoA synthetase